MLFKPFKRIAAAESPVFATSVADDATPAPFEVEADRDNTAATTPDNADIVEDIAPHAVAPANPLSRPEARTIEQTEIPRAMLFNLMLKAMHVTGVRTVAEICNYIKLSPTVVIELLEEASNRLLAEKRGLTSNSNEALNQTIYSFAFGLTDSGRAWALNAYQENQYIGPAPVPLHQFQQQVRRQSIADERITRDMIVEEFSDLTISDEIVRALGPAVNGGRAILLYGPPGNGKTSIATRLGKVFREHIYVPYAVEVDGQLIKVFDPTIHIDPSDAHEDRASDGALLRKDVDLRWAPCRRPLVIAGGELTLEMLDLTFNPIAKFYEAPLHVKALNGTFVIDDFGRQLVKPRDLLNRWIVPLETRIDYLKLQSGKSFSLPFDEVVMFSTNLEIHDLMDPAFLRRIPYKLEVGEPSRHEFSEVLKAVAAGHDLQVTDEDVDLVMSEIHDKKGMSLAFYQPKFVIDQISAACKFEGIPIRFSPDHAKHAIGNL